MTNLDIIKYLAINNPTRLAELLADIYCVAWNIGSYASRDKECKLFEKCDIDDFDKWLHEDASKCRLYYENELKEWKEQIT